jgi:UDP-N-acetylglucosamine 2-epimerase
MTDIHLCPGVDSVENLKREKAGGSIFNVGNTVLDILFNTIRDNNIVITPAGESNQIIITLHRRENWAGLHELFSQIEQLAVNHKDAHFTFIKHPNPELHALAHTLMPSVKCVPPQSYVDCVRMIAACRCIITDSGGIQEEGSALGKKLLVLRETTERTELVGKYVVLCNDALSCKFQTIYDNPTVEPCTMYGVGNSAGTIYDILCAHTEV